MVRFFVLMFCIWLFSESARAAPSAGCGVQAPKQVTRLEVGGQARNFILEVPEPYDPTHPHALVFAFHGRTSPAEEVRGYYDLEAYAPGTLGPTIFVYPVALNQSDGTFGWWDAGDAPNALRDFGLFDALVARLRANYCVDTERIYVVGHSLGGSFVNALGCHRGAVLRGIASLGAGPSAGTCRGEVAAMVLHNPDDELVAFDDGLAARDQYLMQNGLRGPPAPSAPRSLNCMRYGAAGAANPVLWCPHTQDLSYGGRYYPHNWPAETGGAVIRFFASLP
jgi:polyhydroxybutyrate depolymerase